MEPFPYIQSIMLKRDQIPSFERYPFSIPAVRQLSELEFKSEVTFLVGGKRQREVDAA